MKFSINFLALCALPAAGAFVLQTPNRASSQLNSFSYDPASAGPGSFDAPSDGLGTSSPGEGSAISKKPKSVWDTSSPILVQGGSLRTWSFATPAIERVQVLLKTEGRPLNANVELWHGPDNTPQKMDVYLEDGSLRPFSCVIETPRGHNSVSVRNTANLEFPLSAFVEADTPSPGEAGLGSLLQDLASAGKGVTVQGGAIRTYSFDANVESVQILLRTDGRPMNCRIELLQGPNNNKQIVELYSEDGMERPFFAVLETPGVGNVIRVCNTAPVEYPLLASVEPYLVDTEGGNGGINWEGGGTMGGTRW